MWGFSLELMRESENIEHDNLNKQQEAIGDKKKSGGNGKETKILLRAYCVLSAFIHDLFLFFPRFFSVKSPF